MQFLHTTEFPKDLQREAQYLDDFALLLRFGIMLHLWTFSIGLSNHKIIIIKIKMLLFIQADQSLELHLAIIFRLHCF